MKFRGLDFVNLWFNKYFLSGFSVLWTYLAEEEGRVEDNSQVSNM